MSSPIGSREALFAHLFASRPARERRVLPWLIAAAVHAPMVSLFLSNRFDSERSDDQGSTVRALLTVADNPAPLVGPLHPSSLNSAGVTPIPIVESRSPIDAVEPSAAGKDPTAIRDEPLERELLARPAPDPRLLPPARAGAASAIDAVRARVAERLRPFNDSVAAARADAKRASDWTVGDGSGRRWGATPGTLHLGVWSIKFAGATNGGKVPDVIKPPPDRREEAAARLVQWREIEAQSARAGIRSSFQNRVQAIRQRNDTIRAKRRPH